MRNVTVRSFLCRSILYCIHRHPHCYIDAEGVRDWKAVNRKARDKQKEQLNTRAQIHTRMHMWIEKEKRSDGMEETKLGKPERNGGREEARGK